jgi:hypothetical protein
MDFPGDLRGVVHPGRVAVGQQREEALGRFRLAFRVRRNGIADQLGQPMLPQRLPQILRGAAWRGNGLRGLVQAHGTVQYDHFAVRSMAGGGYSQVTTA